MPGYVMTLTSERTTSPDMPALVAAVRTAVNDPAAGIGTVGTGYTVKKTTDWVAGDLSAAQAAIDTAPAFDPASAEIDSKALRAAILGIWEAIPSPLLTRPALRARIIAIWRGL